MSLSNRTQIISTHPFKRTARKKEARIQRQLNKRAEFASLKTMTTEEAYRNQTNNLRLAHNKVPNWAMGVRVVKAGTFNWAVEATAWKGH